jgi:hypothetical protein
MISEAKDDLNGKWLEMSECTFNVREILLSTRGSSLLTPHMVCVMLRQRWLIVVLQILAPHRLFIGQTQLTSLSLAPLDLRTGRTVV